MMSSYYVYELVDPRSNVVFYVGKGQGKRIHAHEIEARSGRVSRKCKTIRDIESENLNLIKRKVKSFADEQAAYDFEAEHIASIGLHNLTNIIPGGGSARQAIPLLKDIETIDAIAELFNRTNGVSSIKMMILGKWVEFSFAESRVAWAKKAYEIAKRRGIDWVNSRASRYMVAFNV